ncbi:tryptophan dimethylallyltransferase family protein [Streptomyces sp. NPDC101181]|uniref:tryptophan dimethylallyltransferase family protein n=1 Tax=Streptomyces sp. NPDC101181 TaxID=3366125 RepID=UPI0038053D64
MTTSREPGIPSAEPGGTTVGEHVLGQLRRLGATVGLGASDTARCGQAVLDSLGDAVRRPLSLPPASPSFLADDHSPVEFSLACTPDAAPALRMLVEPGWAHGTPGGNGVAGLAAVRAMAERWNFATDRLDALEDLFFPAGAQGPLALWYALDLRAGEAPGVKVYLNPSASGPEHAARTVEEALRRLGYGDSFARLPQAAGYPFLALDLGAWSAPRTKVYVRHPRMSADDAQALAHGFGAAAEDTRYFFHVVTGSPPSAWGEAGAPRLLRRPALTCHSFTDGTPRPDGFTLHIPVRDYVRDDEAALARATALLTRFGMDASVLGRSLRALTGRELSEGVGLIAYLALVYERDRPPRITAYLSSEAYSVRPPQQQFPRADPASPHTGAAHLAPRTGPQDAPAATTPKEDTWSRTASRS